MLWSVTCQVHFSHLFLFWHDVYVLIINSVKHHSTVKSWHLNHCNYSAPSNNAKQWECHKNLCYNSWILSFQHKRSHRQYVNKNECGCNKTVFTDTENWISLNFHMSQNSSIVTFLNIKKNAKPFSVHRAFKSQAAVWIWPYIVVCQLLLSACHRNLGK